MSNVNALAEMLRDHSNENKYSIEDIFYDYKSDDYLDFSIYCGNNADMEAIENKINELGFEASGQSSGSGHYIVSFEVATLEDKEAFVEALRERGFNPNGG